MNLIHVIAPFGASLLAADEPKSYVLTAGGWSIMLLSCAFVFILCAWCYYRVLTLPPLEEGEQL